MNKICGIFHSQGVPVLEKEICNMLSASVQGKAVRTSSLLARNCGLGVKTYDTASLADREIFQYSEIDSSLFVTADVRLDNRGELLEKIGIRSVEDQCCPDNKILILAYREWGISCLEHLRGDFAFAIFDARRNRIFCARDQIGVKPLFYADFGTRFIWASSALPIMQAAPKALTEDSRFIAESVFFDLSCFDSTLYHEIKILPPAHALTICCDGLKISRYWEPHLSKEIRFANEQDYEEAFCEQLKQAIQCRLPRRNSWGIELSGGLDSTTIAQLALEVSGISATELRAFSQVLPQEVDEKNAPCRDEHETIRCFCEKSGIREPFWCTSESRGILKPWTRFARPNGGFYCGWTDISSEEIYETAEAQGVTTMLSGFGGDEFVSSSANYTLLELARSKQWLSLMNEIKGEIRLEGVKGLKKSLGQLFHLTDVGRSRFEDRNLQHIEEKTARLLAKVPLTADFIEATGMRKSLVDRLKALNTPLHELSTYQHKFLSLRLFAHRLEIVSMAATSFGIDYRFPLLDLSLLEFYWGLPLRFRRRNGIGRYLFRQVAKGRSLPEIWSFDKQRMSQQTMVTSTPGFWLRFYNDRHEIRKLVDEGRASGQLDEYLDWKKMDRMVKEVTHPQKQKSYRVTSFLNALGLIRYKLEPALMTS